MPYKVVPHVATCFLWIKLRMKLASVNHDVVPGRRLGVSDAAYIVHLQWPST